MSDEEAAAFLEAGHTLQLASINADGSPHLVAMWYVLVDGAPAVWTYARSQKVVNLRRDPRLAGLVETGDRYEALRGVQLNGRAEIVEDPERVQAVGEGLFGKYNPGVELTDDVRAVVARQGAKRVAVLLRPERVVSWDHRKLGGG